VSVLEWLERKLAAGDWTLGQVAVRGHFELCHTADLGRKDLQIYREPEKALEIARFDAAGRYRPLKTAPTLQRGWKLVLASAEDVRTALDFLYPAMLGIRVAHERGTARPVHFRETAARQSGMYAVVRKIPDEAADELIGRFCPSETGCLKTILWRIDANRPVTTLPPDKFDPACAQTATGTNAPPGAVPLLCLEPCNLLVAAARRVIRQTRP
jgi:sirohydrochlorin cobaltochelatase